LGERLLCKQEVIGSIPFTSTSGASGGGGIGVREGQALGPGRRAARVPGVVFEREEGV
jgi:hypothetical protein